MHPLDELAKRVHIANEQWWTDIRTGERLNRNMGEMLCLIHSEISEALEGHRKNLKDDKLPEYDMFDVELADAIIRILDLAGSCIPNFGEIFEAKMEFNANRFDHSIEGRLKEHGKKY